jgi:photosystem II biogenesis protein Psp29
VNTVRTVSDTKRAFYTLHTRPIASVYRRVVEELMVEIHLLRVNENFCYDPIFALGVVGTFDRFMDGYEPTADRDSIFSALCRSEEIDPAQFRAQAQIAEAVGTQHQSAESLLAWIKQAVETNGGDMAGALHTIAHNAKFKYSRLFAIGLYNLIEAADPTLVTDEAKLNAYIEQIAEPLNLSASKIQKDLELYRSNLDKLQQARKAMAEFIEGERRRQQQRAEAQQQAAVVAESTDPQEPDSTASSSEVS